MRNTMETKIKEQFQMPTYHSVPLVFHHQSHAKHANTDDAALGYWIAPADSKQKVHRGRFLMVPDVNLNDYKCRAVIDWVDIGFSTIGEQQAWNIYRSLKKYLVGIGSRSTAFVSGIERRQKFQGIEFVVRLQDPNPQELPQILQALLDQYDVARQGKETFTVAGLEISVDLFPKYNEETHPEAIEFRRWQMSEVLRKHVRAGPAFWISHNDHPRYTVGPEDARETVKLLPATRAGVAAVVRPAGRAGLPAWQARALDVEGHKQAPLDGTVYLGGKDRDGRLNLQDKIANRRRTKGTSQAEELPVTDTRSRIEVQLVQRNWEQRGGPAAVGIQSVRDLYGFGYEGFRKLVFDFELPTLAPDPDDTSKPHPGELSVFTKSGALGVHAYQWVEQVVAQKEGAEGRHWANFDDPTKKMPKGYGLAYGDLNWRVQKALKKLSREWVE